MHDRSAQQLPGLEGLPARPRWLRESRLGLRSPRAMSRALVDRYGKDSKRSMSHVTVWRYEEGMRTPDAADLYAIAELAGVSPGWLLTGEGPVEPGLASDYSAGARAAMEEIRSALGSLLRRHPVAAIESRGRRELVASAGTPGA